MSQTKADLLPDTLVIKLRKPLDVGVGSVSEITLREPTLDEIDKMSKDSEKYGGVMAMKSLIAAMTEIPAAALGLMGARDFKKAEVYLSGFFDNSLIDGETE